MNEFKINNKKIRAEVIADYIGKRRAFAFSCGNATRWLKRAGVNLIPIDGEALKACRFITIEEMDRWFDAFNATSGYLPTYLMERIAKKIESKIPEIKKEKIIAVPFGSGELILALGFFIPLKKIIAIYSNEFAPTRQDGTSPIAEFIKHNCRIAEVKKAKNINDLKKFAKQIGATAFIDTRESEK
ncbi:MAG: hypothetical protein KatS3mg101_1085 [Patescibacteria group bacterium]|nr:MAG: hypothetical protein KatS3mg101_1085 [Patescibacteria group bacterium]